MFSTIKSKLLLITTLMLFFIIFVLSSFMYVYYKEAKKLIIWSCSNSISALAQNVNKEIIKLENNAKDLATIGELYYSFSKNKKFLETSTKKIFDNYPSSLGGGIWFKPYVIEPDKKLSCIYLFHNKNGKLLIDKSFESTDYNYLNQKWYKEITSTIQYKDDNTEWSMPYYEKQGSDSLMITIGSGIRDDKGNIVGISTVDWDISSILKQITEIKPTPNSFALFGNTEDDYILVSTYKDQKEEQIFGKSFKNIPWYNSNLKNTAYITYNNTKYIPYVKNLDHGMELIVNVPKNELFYLIIKQATILSVILFLISIFISLILYVLLSNNILHPIRKLMDIANRISKGESDVEIKLEKPQEFANLASMFDKMTKDIKKITKEREHIESELAIAKSIQESSLPDVFPPFPDRQEFDIYASMTAAKDVGGDFYDFYFIDEDNFMFLIADVSGKGIPAALFMMTVKTLVSNISQNNIHNSTLIETINKRICQSNKNNFFITMLVGIINVRTGKLSLVNCGHNPPLIKQNGGEYKYLQLDSNIVLGIFDEAKFNVYETQLKAGDIIFAYTDGITEALNPNNELYGEDRLLNCINKYKDNEIIMEIYDGIKTDVTNYTQSMPQSDDLTGLIFKYNGSFEQNNERIFKTEAKLENYKQYYTWLHNICNEWELDSETINKIDMCAEELYANITFYAYPEKNGYIEVKIKKNKNNIQMQYIDEGIPYNPLEKADPDITLPPEQRQLGGLGIFMLKQMAYPIVYDRCKDKNILTINFKLI